VAQLRTYRRVICQDAVEGTTPSPGCRSGSGDPVEPYRWLMSRRPECGLTG
jgi:hypothetical protein